MDAVVDLGESALEVPIELEVVVFVVLEALELLDQVKLELRAEPGAELESDVLVRVSASVSPGARDQAFATSKPDPFLGR